MAVLKLTATEAPDFKGVSAILERAGLSMDRAFDSAGGLLSSYQAGEQERVDNEVFAETAGMNREDLQAFFDNNGLKGRRLSQKGRERLGGQAAATADVNRTRGLTASTADETSRLNLVSGRKTVEAERIIAERLADRETSLPFADAMSAALEFGTGAQPNAAGGPGGGGAPQSVPGAGVSSEFAQVIPGIFAGESKGDYDALYGFSNRPGGKFENVKVTEMSVNELLEFQKPSGEYGQWVKSQNDGTVATPAGGFQIVGTTLQAAAEGLNLTGDEKMTPELQDKLGEWVFQNQGLGAWKGYQPQATADAQFAATADGPAPTPQTGASATLQAAVGGGGQTAQQLGLAALRANPNLSTDERVARRAQLAAAGAQGDATLKKEAEEARVEEVATNLTAALEDPEITDYAALRKSVDENTAPGGTNVDKLATWSLVQQASEDFISILNPKKDLPDGVMAATAAQMSIQDNVLAAMPQTYTYDLAATLVGGPAAPRNGIVKLLNLDTDPESPEDQFLFWGEDGKDLNILDKLIAEIATDAKVTHAVAAAAMIKHFVRNPTGSNLAKYRFQQDVTTEWLKKNMDPQSMRLYESERLSILAKKDDYKNDAEQLTKWMTLREKQVRKNTDTTAIDKKIEKLTNTMLRGHTSKQSPQAKASQALVATGPNRTELNQISERISMLHNMKLGSRSHVVVGRTLRKQVEESTTLSDLEKRLLLAEIKG